MQVAWAPNKGVKDNPDAKSFWDEVEGATYIPLDRFPVANSQALLDGGAEFDDESMTDELREKLKQVMIFLLM